MNDDIYSDNCNFNSNLNNKCDIDNSIVLGGFEYATYLDKDEYI